MSIENWSVQTTRRAAETSKAKIAQFGLIPLYEELNKEDGFEGLRESFLGLGVWSLYNPEPIFKAINRGREFSILVGMRPTQKYHLGHLTLMKELSWLQNSGGLPVFILASYESGRIIDQDELQRSISLFSENYMRFTKSTLPAETLFLSDREDMGIRLFEDQVSEQLKLSKILQLYGWGEEVSLADIRVVSMTVAAFLYPSVIYPQRPTIILSDINQITHAEMTKIVARKLGLQVPTFSYRVLLPSLEGAEKRMSIKDPKSTVFLDDQRDKVYQKMKRAFSGGRKTVEEQRTLGGEPLRCSFFKITNTLVDYQESTDMYNNCVSGSVTCGECKLKHLPKIVEKFSESNDTI